MFFLSGSLKRLHESIYNLDVRLIHIQDNGDGSVTSIRISTKDGTSRDYSAYAVYEQGSTKGKIHKPYSVLDAIVNFKNNLLIPVGFPIAGAVITVSLLMYQRYNKRFRNELFERYIDNPAKISESYELSIADGVSMDKDVSSAADALVQIAMLRNSFFPKPWIKHIDKNLVDEFNQNSDIYIDRILRERSSHYGDKSSLFFEKLKKELIQRRKKFLYHFDYKAHLLLGDKIKKYTNVETLKEDPKKKSSPF